MRNERPEPNYGLYMKFGNYVGGSINIYMTYIYLCYISLAYICVYIFLYVFVYVYMHICTHICILRSRHTKITLHVSFQYFFCFLTDLVMYC